MKMEEFRDDSVFCLRGVGKVTLETHCLTCPCDWKRRHCWSVLL